MDYHTSPLGVKTKTQLPKRSLVMVSTNSLELMLPTNSSCHSLIALSQPTWRKERASNIKLAFLSGNVKWYQEILYKDDSQYKFSRKLGIYPECYVRIVKASCFPSWTSTIWNCMPNKTSNKDSPTIMSSNASLSYQIHLFSSNLPETNSKIYWFGFWKAKALLLKALFGKAPWGAFPSKGLTSIKVKKN